MEALRKKADVQIGILGAGRVGTAVARQAMRAGHRVLIAASGDPERISLIVDVMAPGATPVRAEDAIGASDVVVLSLPLHKADTLDPALLVGKVVVDAMNYWPEADGHVPGLEASPSSSEMVQSLLDGARVVKSLNHIGYHELETDHAPAGAQGRRALGVAGDDPDARALVMALVEQMGYDAVDAGPLAAGRALEPGTEIFNGRHDRQAMERLLARTVPTTTTTGEQA